MSASPEQELVAQTADYARKALLHWTAEADRLEREYRVARGQVAFWLSLVQAQLATEAASQEHPC